MRAPRSFVALLGVGAVVGAVLHRTVRRYEVAERSMSPTLEPGDYLLATRIDRPAPGDMIVFPHPEREGLELVKRVIAFHRQRVTISGGQVHVDGVVLAEPWADGPTRPDGEWVLPHRSAFVLGDQRALSTADSRDIGPIPVDGNVWRVAARYWPLDRIGTL